ncbi:MAG: hypothetical protein IJM08_05225 [Firmicutes bacterium]|nr:hypothetical protein [Bacillota bacterium]
MKKQNKAIIAILVLLVIAAAVFAVIHLTTRENVPEGAIAIHVGEDVKYVDPSKLTQVPVQGTVINGKGQEIPVDEQGYELSELLKAAKIDISAIGGIKVTAADEFSASLTKEEVNESGKAYIVQGEDGLQLVVFGDPNMKRNVRNVERIEVE